MFKLAATLILSVLLRSTVNAAPALVELSKRQSITGLTSAQITAFKPFTNFASTAYCQPSTTLSWTCGANCNANADFIPVASGGDGSSVQFWYVGFSPSQATVIVAHQGTDTTKIEADATDADAILESLSPTLFPGVSSSVEAHSGFANEQAKTATTILAAVQKAIAAHAATRVTIVGHSLGAAIALLDGVYLPLHITGVTFRTIGYGMPRVGNQAFANYVDAHLTLTHINNKEDLVPILPGRFLGYVHPSGEVHIMDNNQWVSCPGQDNTSTECTVGDVPNIFDGATGDHDGPYDGVDMGC
ncbi:lipase class 3 family protein [Crassisporium funariophilum]|nr:lipase class 3 family protein [Crassisporium funariophilum]